MSAPLDCKEVSRMISEGQDRELSESDRARLRAHFVICKTCRTVDEQMQFLRRALRALGKGEPPAG